MPDQLQRLIDETVELRLLELLGPMPRVDQKIPDDPDAWDVPVRGAARLARSLRDRRREAYLFRNLSILRTDVPLPDDLEHLAWRGARRAELTALARRLGEEAVLARVPRWQE